MINNVNSSTMMQSSHPPRSNSLTEDQKQTVSDIISKYDSSNISDSDFRSMMSEIHDAGITPSRDLRNMVEEAGFTMPEGNGPQGVKGEGRPPKPSESVLNLMNKIETGEISEEDMLSYIQNLQNESGNTTGSIMDEYV